MKAELHVLDAEPVGPDIIERLEEVLEVAREGKLSSVAMAFVWRDGTCGHVWSSSPSLSCLVGAVARMQNKLIRFADE